MPRNIQKELEGLIPDFRNILEPQVEQKLYIAFLRIYEYFTNKLKMQQEEFDIKLRNLAAANVQNISSLNSLMGAFSQPLTGSSVTDELVEGFVKSPIPIQPAQPATQLNADGTILDVNSILDGEYLKRTGATIVSGFPAGTTALGAGYLPLVETILYTVPVGKYTLIKKIVIVNESAAPVIASFFVRNAAAALIFTDDYPLLANEELIIDFNQLLQANFTLRGNADIANIITYTIFGIEENI